MKPLHTTYHNLGSWKMVGAARDPEVHIVYHALPVILSGLLVFSLCMAAAAALYFKLPPEEEKKGLVVCFVAGIGVVVPSSMTAYAVSRSKKGPILTYKSPGDVLLISEPSLEITNAYQRVSFSFERYWDGGRNDRYEFNLMVDGERRKFLSSSVDSFSKISGFVTEMGFRVSKHTIKS
jgi:hypothetical protein